MSTKSASGDLIQGQQNSLVKLRQFVVPGPESTPQKSFFGEASGSVPPCQQFSQARNIVSLIFSFK